MFQVTGSLGFPWASRAEVGASKLEYGPLGMSKPSDLSEGELRASLWEVAHV